MEVFAITKRHRIPCAPVRDVGEVMHDAHMHERGMLEWIEHDEIGRIVVPTSPPAAPAADSGIDQKQCRCFPAWLPVRDPLAMYGVSRFSEEAP